MIIKGITQKEALRIMSLLIKYNLCGGVCAEIGIFCDSDTLEDCCIYDLHYREKSGFYWDKKSNDSVKLKDFILYAALEDPKTIHFSYSGIDKIASNSGEKKVASSKSLSVSIIDYAFNTDEIFRKIKKSIREVYPE